MLLRVETEAGKGTHQTMMQRTMQRNQTRPSAPPVLAAGHPNRPDWSLEFPHEVDGDLQQDSEWCHLRIHGERRRLRFHDYDQIYLIPGLYEHLFYEKLKCSSPQVIAELLSKQVDASDDSMGDLKILDLGAGNGMVGEALIEAGADSVIGVDIIREAAQATKRDRPGLYEDYLVDDLTQPSSATRTRLDREPFTCLASVSALGFGDIPPLAFCEAFNAVSTPGWVAFNIKEDFLTRRDDTGFCGLIHRMFDEGIMEMRDRRRYQHRLGVSGQPLYYVAVIATKERDVPEPWMAALREENGAVDGSPAAEASPA